jgi:DNA primase
MKDGIQMRFMFLPDGEDPDSLVRKEGKMLFEQRMQNALTIADFFFQTLATQTDLGTTDGRARFVKLALEHLEQLPESIFQQMMFEELAKRTRLSIDQLKPATKPSFQPKPNPHRARSPSALRLGMALLVQHPELAQHLTKPLPKLDLNGYELFLQLVEHISQHPNLNTGTLLEHWRDKPEAPLIAKLAQLEHMIPDTGIKNEFLGAIQRLAEFERKQIIETMLMKASQTGLTPEEKQQLHEMIQADS